jgi:hypothetical protein
VQAKEGGNVELKTIVTHRLGDGVRSIAEWKKLLMGSCKAFFLQVQPNFISHQTCVALSVDHGVACTWHWTSEKYSEPVGGCVVFVQ